MTVEEDVTDVLYYLSMVLVPILLNWTARYSIGGERTVEILTQGLILIPVASVFVVFGATVMVWVLLGGRNR